jgi:cytochrome P450
MLRQEPKRRGVSLEVMPTRTVTEPADVRLVLASDAFAVPEAPAGDTGMAWLRATVSRFANGADHARRRAVALAEVERLSPAGLRRAAEARIDDVLDSAAGGGLDLMPLARRIPVATLAAELGAPEGTADDVVAVAAVYAPGSGESSTADAAVERLVEVLGDGEAGAVRISLLVQACDATAALIGNALAAGLAAPEPLGVDELLDVTVRRDPPVRVTRRVCRTPAVVGDEAIEPGDAVVLDLEAAEATFGAGIRPCPGSEQALALATGFVEPVLRRCALAGELRWAPSPNLRVLERLDVVVA